MNQEPARGQALSIHYVSESSLQAGKMYISETMPLPFQSITYVPLNEGALGSSMNQVTL